jgi:glycerol-3-phosphate dehydrogenase
LCIAGDAAAALGTRTFLDNAGLGDLPVTYAPAWTRNPRTFGTRMSRLAPAEPILAGTSSESLAGYLAAGTGLRAHVIASSMKDT